MHCLAALQQEVESRSPPPPPPLPFTPQVLQTLSIIIQNVRSETGIFFLFSNNHVNNIVSSNFDFEDEEVLGYYISFLKAISLKLNPLTVRFFLLKAPTPDSLTTTPTALTDQGEAYAGMSCFLCRNELSIGRATQGELLNCRSHHHSHRPGGGAPLQKSATALLSSKSNHVQAVT